MKPIEIEDITMFLHFYYEKYFELRLETKWDTNSFLRTGDWGGGTYSGLEAEEYRNFFI